MWNASKHDIRRCGDVMGCCSIGGVDTVRGSNIDKVYGEGQSPGKICVRSGRISKISYAVCACLFTLQIMVLNTDFPDTEGEQAATLNNNYLITHTNTCTYIYILFKKSNFYNKTFKRSYMFRTHDHPQGIYIVPCKSYNLKHSVNYFITLTRFCVSRTAYDSHTKTRHAATAPS